MRILFAVVLAAALSGCGGGMFANRAQLAALDQNTCLNYGFRPGTDAYASCMMELDQVRAQDNRERRAAFAESMRQLARDLNPPRRRGFHCTTTSLGVVSTTNCR